MKGEKSCRVMSCCWHMRYEIVGVILLVLATLMTLFTLSSLGIAAMFIVGAWLCCHKYCMCCKTGHHHTGMETDMMACSEEDKPAVKKTVRKTVAK